MPTVTDRKYATSVGTTLTSLEGPTVNNNDSSNLINLTNRTASGILASMVLWPLGNSGNQIQLLNQVPLMANESFAFRGVLYMLATSTIGQEDEILIQSDTAASLDGIMSLLRKANVDPPPQRQRSYVQGLTTVQSVYTAPATRGVMNGLILCNTSGVSVNVDVELVVGANRAYFRKSLPLAAAGRNATYWWDGVLCLNSGDKVEITSSNTIDVLTAIQES